MAKYDFNSSRYARFFSSQSNIRFLQTYVDNVALFQTNFGFWKENFVKADTMTPVSPEGPAAFMVKAKIADAAPLMDLRDRLGDTNTMDTEGISFYTGTIPDLAAPGIKETALERYNKELQFAEFGNDADIINAWTQKVQTLKDSADSTLSNMSAQLLSTGKIIWNYGKGNYAPLQKAEIPARNFKSAGEKVWTAADCNILAQMVELEKNYREESGFAGAMKWQIPYEMFHNVLLKNAEVKLWIKDYRYHASLPWEANAVPTEEVFRQAIVDYPGLSPIEVVVEKQRNVSHSGVTTVHGWDSKTAVLRPQGFAGNIMYADLIDVKLGQMYSASNIIYQAAQLEGGIYSLVNTTCDNGRFKEWHTDVLMSAIPALTEFPNHVIVDTTVADA